ncbi:hypothetical protein ACJX0J_034765, partial [Zea mays]
MSLVIVIQELGKLLKQLILTRVFSFAMYPGKRKILVLQTEVTINHVSSFQKKEETMFYSFPVLKHRKKHRNRCSSKQKGVPAVIFTEYISVYKNYLEYIVYINYFLINDAAGTSSHVSSKQKGVHAVILREYISVYRNYFLISDAARTSSHVEYISVYINYFLINDAARTSSHVSSKQKGVPAISRVYISVYINYFLISDAARTSSHLDSTSLYCIQKEYISVYRNYLSKYTTNNLLFSVVFRFSLYHIFPIDCNFYGEYLKIFHSTTCVFLQMFAFGTLLRGTITICATDSAQNFIELFRS